VSPSIQVKLLRLLQEKEFQRLGDTRSKKADVRFVAATHQVLEAMIEKGDFREDLYFRLNVIPIWIPPLRDRPEDVRALSGHFLANLARADDREPMALSDGAVDALLNHDWPGNVRELQNVMERLVVFCDADVVEAPHVKRELERSRPRSSRQAPASGRLADRVSEAERAAVVDALERAGGNCTQAARVLDVSRRTLYNRIDEYGIVVDRS
jgi:transcriptional regulator with PAS, ATPase and Fis domain